MASTGARPRGRYDNGSLGDSWGTADYSDGDISIGSADSLSDAGSQSDYFERRNVLDEDDEDDMATPMPQTRTTRASRSHVDTPTKTTARTHVPGGSRSIHNQTSRVPPEPAFIMPSPHASVYGSDHASPTHIRKSQLKSRNPRQTSDRSQIRQQMTRTPPAGSRQAAPKFRQRRDSEEVNPWHFASLFWDNVGRPIAIYLLDVFALFWATMKPLLSIAMAIGVIILALNLASTWLKDTVHTALTPICAIPGSSYIIPMCTSTSLEGRVPDFEELARVQSSFEDVLAGNKHSYELPANMMKSQIAIRDLRTKVKFSNLPSRTQLVVEFNGFVEMAKEASDKLQRYTHRIGYVTDRVISTNGWTLRVLEGIADAEESRSPVMEMLASLNPFAVLTAPPPTLEEQVFHQYIAHIAQVKNDIIDLIGISVSLVDLLHHLDARLDAIGELAQRDDKDVSRSREELLAHLWSKLGGNRSSKAAHKANLDLLRDVMYYKADALNVVGATLIKLRAISQELENLRDGIAAPEVVGYREEYPLQWHIDVVERSMERLKDVRGEAKAIESSVMNKGFEALDNGYGTEKASSGQKALPMVHASTTT